jgi:hypothetical protein
MASSEDLLRSERKKKELIFDPVNNFPRNSEYFGSFGLRKIEKNSMDIAIIKRRIWGFLRTSSYLKILSMLIKNEPIQVKKICKTA